MPGKSRHGKRKHSFQSKKKKRRQHFPATAARQGAVTPSDKPVAPPQPVAPSVSVPASRATPAIARSPYIVAELRRIGILAGIMLAILIVLALVLS